jgi:hypothetical protein
MSYVALLVTIDNGYEYFLLLSRMAMGETPREAV